MNYIPATTAQILQTYINFGNMILESCEVYEGNEKILPFSKKKKKGIRENAATMHSFFLQKMLLMKSTKLLKL